MIVLFWIFPSEFLQICSNIRLVSCTFWKCVHTIVNIYCRKLRYLLRNIGIFTYDVVMGGVYFLCWMVYSHGQFILRPLIFIGLLSWLWIGCRGFRCVRIQIKPLSWVIYLYFELHPLTTWNIKFLGNHSLYQWYFCSVLLLIL